MPQPDGQLPYPPLNPRKESSVEEDGFEPSVPPEKGPTSSRCSTVPALPFREGPMVRIRLPPAASLSRECLPCLPAQRPGFRPECEPGRDQRKGRADHEPARLGCFSLIGIDAVSPREIEALNERSPGPGPG